VTGYVDSSGSGLVGEHQQSVGLGLEHPDGVGASGEMGRDIFQRSDFHESSRELGRVGEGAWFPRISPRNPELRTRPERESAGQVAVPEAPDAPTSI